MPEEGKKEIKEKPEDVKHYEKIEKLADDLEALSKRTGKNKTEVMRELIKLVDEKEHDEGDALLQLAEAVKSIGGNSGNVTGGSSMLKDMMEARVIDKLSQKMDSNDGMNIDLNKIMAFNILKSMMKPDLEEILMKERLMKRFEEPKETNKPNESNEMWKLFMQQQIEQEKARAKQNQALIEMVFGKKIEETKTEAIEARKKEQEDLIQRLQNMEILLNSQQKRGGLTDEIKKFSEFRNAMIDFAKAEGLKEKDLTDKEGKVNWAEVLRDLGGKAENILVELAKRPPSPKVVQPLPVVPSKPVVNSNITTHPQKTIKPEKPKTSVKPKIFPPATSGEIKKPYQDSSGRWRYDGKYINTEKAKELLGE